MAIRLRGQPKAYECVEDMKKQIQYYFDSITRDMPQTVRINIGTDEEPNYIDKPILNNAGEQLIHVEFVKNPSVVGLCLFLGIHRDTLCEYEKKEEYSDTIREAKQIILDQKLELLPTLKNPRGMMFDLSANYGMHEKQVIESENINHNLNDDVSDLTEEELDKKIEELKNKNG